LPDSLPVEERRLFLSNRPVHDLGHDQPQATNELVVARLGVEIPVRVLAVSVQVDVDRGVESTLEIPVERRVSVLFVAPQNADLRELDPYREVFRGLGLARQELVLGAL
jgi:hypothetical protein